MTADVAAPPRRDGEKETKKEGMDGGNVVKALVQILGSEDPEDTLLRAIYNGAIPDEICLELAEHLDELVRAKNFDNRIEIVFARRKSGAISEKTEQHLLLAILEMDEQEETEVEVSDKLIEITVTVVPLPVTTDQALEVPPPTPKTSEDTLIADLIRLAAELQAQFANFTTVPEEKLSEIRQAVRNLTEEEFSSLRQILGSAILAEAEIPTDQRGIDISASLEVIGILLDPRQAELTHACFSAYEILVREGFHLTHRNGYDRPLMTVASIKLLRNRFRGWLDSRESDLGPEELASAQKAVATLEGFLLAAADDFTKTAIQRDRATRLRERIVSSRIRALDLIGEELVAAQPTTKEEALQQVHGYLRAKQSKLASELRTAGSAILGEAEATILQIFNLYSAAIALRREMAELKASDYNPLAQRPMLSSRDKRLAVYELEWKELDSIRVELEAALEEGPAADRNHNRNRKKLQILLVITAGKLQELDQLIAGLRPAPALEVRHG